MITNHYVRYFTQVQLMSTPNRFYAVVKCKLKPYDLEAKLYSDAKWRQFREQTLLLPGKLRILYLVSMENCAGVQNYEW